MWFECGYSRANVSSLPTLIFKGRTTMTFFVYGYIVDFDRILDWGKEQGIAPGSSALGTTSLILDEIYRRFEWPYASYRMVYHKKEEAFCLSLADTITKKRKNLPPREAVETAKAIFGTTNEPTWYRGFM